MAGERARRPGGAPDHCPLVGAKKGCRWGRWKKCKQDRQRDEPASAGNRVDEPSQEGAERGGYDFKGWHGGVGGGEAAGGNARVAIIRSAGVVTPARIARIAGIPVVAVRQTMPVGMCWWQWWKRFDLACQ